MCKPDGTLLLRSDYKFLSLLVKYSSSTNKDVSGDFTHCIVWKPFGETLSFRKIARTHLLGNQTCSKLTVAVWICFRRSPFIWGELTYWVGQKFGSAYGKTNFLASPISWRLVFKKTLCDFIPLVKKLELSYWLSFLLVTFLFIISDLQFWDNCVIQVLTPFLLMRK